MTFGSHADRDPPAYLFLTEDQVPDRWRSRAIPLLLVPLLPHEASTVLAGRETTPALSRDDEHLAGLVARGQPVSAIARDLGEPLRTVQRRVASLRRKLGAATTQELAARLASRGLAGGADAPEE